MRNLDKKKHRKKRRKENKILVVLILSIILILGGISIYIINAYKENTEDNTNKNVTESVSVTLPWENGGKSPAEYSLEEFEKLTNIQQELFYEWFDSKEDFEQWMSNAEKRDEAEIVVVPWEGDGKKPSEYTMEEFEKLSDIQQELFFEWFDSTEEFQMWYDAND